MVKKRVKVREAHNFRDCMGEVFELKRGSIHVLAFKSLREFNAVMELGKLRALPMEIVKAQPRRFEDEKTPETNPQDADTPKGDEKKPEDK